MNFYNAKLCNFVIELFFFWRKCSTVVEVGVQTSFFACGWIGLLIFLRNEKKQCAKCARIAKSVTEKNNSRVDCAEAPKKTVQAMRYEWWGFFGAGDFFCKNSGYTRHSSNKFGSALTCTVFALRSCP